MFVFGSGVLIGTQLNVANPTPINFGLVQKVSVDTSVSVKELYGQFAFPVAVGSGTRKVTCKATLARFSGQALGRLFYNQTPIPGATISQFAEVHSVPAAAPFTITVSNATHFVADQGVTYAASGLPLLNVATLTAAGQYTFNAVDRRLHLFHGRSGRRRPNLLHLHANGHDDSEPGDRQPAYRADVHVHSNAFRYRPHDERAVLGDAQPVRRQQVLVRHQYRGLRQAGLRVPGVRQRSRSGHDLQLRRRGVSEDVFAVSLGGKTWSVPHLPFRAIKVIQPALFDVYLAAGGASMSGDSVARLSEAQLDRLAEATWRAVSFVEPELSLTKFLDLAFSVGELIQAFPSVAKAVGLQPGKIEDQASPAPVTQGVSQDLGKSISTP